MRPDGFYWVRWNFTSPGEDREPYITDWEPAELYDNGKYWQMMGGDNLLGEPCEIGPRIEPPTDAIRESFT